MQHIPLNSSNLKSAAYDPATRTLEVTFTNGGTYEYSDVDARHFEQLQSHPSPGGYFHTHVRSAHNSTRKS